MSDFKEKVYEVVRKIPKGSVLTYKQVAVMSGYPRAIRAVGTVLRQNYDPTVPCHRVVKSDGSFGNYNRGGTKTKINILNKEGYKVLLGKSKYIWTEHSKIKMRKYRLSESFIKRTIRHPNRIEQGIAGPSTVGAMKIASTKKYSEIWVLYVPDNGSQIKVISAWRYPGKSPEKDPVPHDILEEIQGIIM